MLNNWDEPVYQRHCVLFISSQSSSSSTPSETETMGPTEDERQQAETREKRAARADVCRFCDDASNGDEAKGRVVQTERFLFYDKLACCCCCFSCTTNKEQQNGDLLFSLFLSPSPSGAADAAALHRRQNRNADGFSKRRTFRTKWQDGYQFRHGLRLHGHVGRRCVWLVFGLRSVGTKGKTSWENEKNDGPIRLFSFCFPSLIGSFFVNQNCLFQLGRIHVLTTGRLRSNKNKRQNNIPLPSENLDGRT